MTVEANYAYFRAVAHELPQRATPTWIVNVHRISDGHHIGPQMWLTRKPMPDELVRLLQEWICEKAGSAPAPKVYCGTGCGTELVPESNTDTDYQFDNALEITFNGGYGMFIDPMFDAPPKTLICHECAHALCEAHPWMNDLLNPQSSHSHKTPYVEAHPNHFGWDYDSRKEREHDGAPAG